MKKNKESVNLFSRTLFCKREEKSMKKVVIVGGGFAGLNAAKILGNQKNIKVVLIDRRNHHLFQPLLYQVAMAGLSPAEIAAPIRALLSKYKNISVVQDEIIRIDKENQTVQSHNQSYDYDYLIMACGARHTYFGNEKWEEFAPGLKTLEEATEIRRRVLNSFEQAEIEKDLKIQKQLLTFIIVGGGPTGVELAGAIGEMSRYTLAKDFRNINPKQTRIILLEAGSRILKTFDEKLSEKASRDLEALGVQIWTNSRVEDIDENAVQIGKEYIEAKTVLWAAGVQSSGLNTQLHDNLDFTMRVPVEDDLSLKNYKNIFICGDQALKKDSNGNELAGVAPVAMQQGRFLGKLILDEMKGKTRKAFHYIDKGSLATIGRSKAICEVGPFKFTGFLAWLIWLVIHIYYLTGFKNRFFVVFQWAWSYLNFGKGARLIVGKNIFK